MANSAQAEHKLESAAEKVKAGANQAMEKGREMAQTVADKAKEAGTAMRDRADAGAASVGGGFRSAADSMREHLPQSGMIGSAAASVEDTLENTGRYLEDKGVSGAAEDLTKLIRQHPVPSLLIGLGIGILLGSFLTSSRR